ncbi:MAG TPA: hypothetical protein VGG27_20035 [Magnetospirillaceae bacterium]|jgi:hypothetical protein
MFGFLGRLVLTKSARDAVGKARAQSPAKNTGTKAGGKTGGKDAAIAAMQAQSKDFMTAERAELIQNAMKVRQAKQSILADLSDEQRARLVGEAMKRLLNEGKK